MPKANPNQIRLPVMFDLTDPRQKAAYEILKNAGYGKRTPIIVDALLDSLKTNVLLSQAKESSASNMSETDIRRAVEDSMESVLNRYFSKSEASAPQPQPEPVQTPTPASVIQEPAPVQPAPHTAAKLCSVCSCRSCTRTSIRTGRGTHESAALYC